MWAELKKMEEKPKPVLDNQSVRECTSTKELLVELSLLIISPSVTHKMALIERCGCSNSFPGRSALKKHSRSDLSLNVPLNFTIDDMKTRLEKNANSEESLAEKKNDRRIQLLQKKQSNDSGISTDETLDHTRSIMEENKNLHKRLSKVMEMNKKWQSYNQEREKYVRKLLKRIDNLESNSSDEITNGLETVPKNQYFILQSSYENSVKYNCILEKEIADTKKSFDNLVSQFDQMKSEYEEHLKLTNLQTKLNKEEFQVEKKEKDQAKVRCQKLMTELSVLKSTVSYDNSLQSEQACSTNKTGLDLPNTKSNGLSNGRENCVTSRSINPGRRHNHDDDDVLECPSCFRKFPTLDHHLLLKHFNNCDIKPFTN